MNLEVEVVNPNFNKDSSIDFINKVLNSEENLFLDMKIDLRSFDSGFGFVFNSFSNFIEFDKLGKEYNLNLSVKDTNDFELADTEEENLLFLKGVKAIFLKNGIDESFVFLYSKLPEVDKKKIENSLIEVLLNSFIKFNDRGGFGICKDVQVDNLLFNAFGDSENISIDNGMNSILGKTKENSIIFGNYTDRLKENNPSSYSTLDSFDYYEQLNFLNVLYGILESDDLVIDYFITMDNIEYSKLKLKLELATRSIETYKTEISNSVLVDCVTSLVKRMPKNYLPKIIEDLSAIEPVFEHTVKRTESTVGWSHTENGFVNEKINYKGRKGWSIFDYFI